MTISTHTHYSSQFFLSLISERRPVDPENEQGYNFHNYNFANWLPLKFSFYDGHFSTNFLCVFLFDFPVRFYVQTIFLVFFNNIGRNLFLLPPLCRRKLNFLPSIFLLKLKWRTVHFHSKNFIFFYSV